MILAYAIIFLLILALLLRRDLSAIGKVKVRSGKKLLVIIIGLYVAQAVLVVFVPGQTTLQMAVLILSQTALGFLFVLNRHLPGAKLFALGIFLNLLVMVANGGWMPITAATYQYVHPEWPPVEIGTRAPDSKNVILPREETNLWILSDIIPVFLPWRGWAISVGDVLLIVGIAQFIFQATSKREKITANSTGGRTSEHKGN